MMTRMSATRRWTRRAGYAVGSHPGRRGPPRIGFGGVLVSDDLGMQALAGTPAARALRHWRRAAMWRCIAAANLPHGRSAGALPALSEAAMARLAAARALAASRRTVLEEGALANERDRF